MGFWTVTDVAGLSPHWQGAADPPAAWGDRTITGWSIDARTLEAGQAFLALRGERTHGAAHWAQALERGASVMVVASGASATDIADATRALPVLITGEDNFALLARLGRAWRERTSFTVVAVTGSSGKTSTKDMIGALLSHGGARRVVRSHANYNNEIGVPLTLLSAAPDADVVICEMGMRGSGQIAWLCDIATPDVGVVTNAGSAHIELLGSRAAIVAAKAEILAGSNVGVVPAWQPELLAAATRQPTQVLRFGDAAQQVEGGADVSVVSVGQHAQGLQGELDVRGERLSFELPVHGLHQARNLAAATCAYIAVTGSTDGLAAAFHDVRITAGRGDRYPLRGGGVLIDDAYNANPESMRAAIASLVATSAPGRHLAVLGYMAELGDRLSPALHAHLGEHAARHGVDELHVVATHPDAEAIARSFADARGVPVTVSPDVDSAVDAVREWLQPGDAVLVKASNSVGLGRLARAIVESVGVMDGAATGAPGGADA